MNDSIGQFGVGGSAPDAQDQGKVNPMSPTFMDSASGLQPPPPPATPSNPPMGGNPAVSPPPPPPPLPPVAPPQSYEVPTGEPAFVPPPPPKEVDIRTMVSDQESLKTSGGLDPTPITAMPTVANMSTKKMDSVGAFKKRPSGNKKALLIGLGIIIFLGAAAAVANYFVLPLFLNNVVDVDKEAQVVVPEESELTPDVTPTIPSFIHESLFDGPTDAEAEVRISEISLAGIKGGMTPVVANALASGNTLTEFSVTTGDAGQPVTAEEFLGAILPDLILETTPLEDDFTGFLYSDGVSVWPGYLFVLDGTVEDRDLLKNILGEDLEASGSLSNFFLNDPGAPSAALFNNGNAVGELTGIRYLPYTTSGASFDYGWKGDRLVISTSYAGLKSVASMVGDSGVLDSGAGGTL